MFACKNAQADLSATDPNPRTKASETRLGYSRSETKGLVATVETFSSSLAHGKCGNPHVETGSEAPGSRAHDRLCERQAPRAPRGIFNEKEERGRDLAALGGIAGGVWRRLRGKHLVQEGRFGDGLGGGFGLERVAGAAEMLFDGAE